MDISLARIERALARIEAAAPADDGGAAEELRQAHLALRRKVEGAIAEIDGLLAAGEQG